MSTSSQDKPRGVAFAERLPYVPLLLAIGGVTLAASLFARWFDVSAGAFSGFEGPSAAQVAQVRDQFAQTGWDFWDGGDVVLFALGVGLALLAVYDAVRHALPHAVLAFCGLLCALALVVLVTDGFTGDSVQLLEGTLGEGSGQVLLDRSRAGGQWVAFVGLVVALAGLVLGWRERRRPDGAGMTS